MVSLCGEAVHGESLQQLLQRRVLDLSTLLAAETKKFLSGQPYDDRAGLALFTLAIKEGSQEAWECLYHHYKPLVLTWLTRHSQAARLLAEDGDATLLIDSTFCKFFQAISETKLERFNSVAALLKYLQRCASSVIADRIRYHRVSEEMCPLEAIEYELATDDPERGILATMQAQYLWQVIQEEVKNEDEYWLLHQIYVLGRRPKEICQNAPRIFPTVDDVYRIKRNVLERLRRNQRIRQEFAVAN